MKKGIAIVTSGGGMGCSYSVGALMALIEKYKLTDPDIVVCSSGSAGTLSYFVARQYNSITNIWINLLCDRKFISFFRIFKVMDIDYVIDDIFKKQDPLKIENIKKSKIKFFIAATDFETGKLKYFCNKDDIFEAMRASKATPIAFNKIIKIGNKKYIDGVISSTIESNIKKAMEEGATKIIVINNSEKSAIKYIFFKIYSFFVNKNLRNSINDYLNKSKIKSIKNDSVMLIKPSVKLPASNLDNNQKHIKKTISIGYNDIINNKKLQSFLGK